MRIFYHTFDLLRTLRKEHRAIKEQSGYRIQFFNCWDQRNEDMYWRQFIESHHLMDDFEGSVAIFSVFGRRKMISKVKADVKLFYSAENLKTERYKEYADNCLGSVDIDLAMGFDRIEDSRFERFPLWMDYMFDPWLSEEEIRARCAQLRYPTSSGRSKFCCMVASNPGDGLRREMFDTISAIAPVCSAGRYLHNDDSLKNDFNDVKADYLSQFAFNICPENTDAEGYVTEKIFESIKCGCIPVYWGSNLNPEPDVLNQDVIIKWNRIDGGRSAVEKLESLIGNPAMLRELVLAPKLVDTAEEYILDTFSSIRNKLELIFKK